MRTMLAGVLMGCAALGCAAGAAAPPETSAAAAEVAPGPGARQEGAPGVAAAPAAADGTAAAAAPVAAVAAAPTAVEAPGSRAEASRGVWIGAAGASDFVLPGTRETQLGVWVDVPAARRGARAPAAVALLVDASGSMQGPKMDHARAAAQAFVDGLPDGDLVSLVSFADAAVERVAPAVLGPETRPAVARAIAALGPEGSTNLFEGLRLAERHAAAAPSTHAVRRVVLISDGQANIGPSSPELLGALAQRGAAHGVQITSIGVGADYDERTLNALALGSSGRLYHLTEARQMSSVLERELALLQTTAATGAFVEIVPAPGVEVIGVPNERADRSGDAVRVLLGTMFGGQHREMLVRVRVTAPAAGSHPLASVRLHFRDPENGNVPRVQEVVARYEVTSDPAQVAAHENERTQTLAAVIETGMTQLAAAQDVGSGDFGAAEAKLAAAEERLRQQAARAQSAKEKARIAGAASAVASARKTARAAAAAPPAARRMDALQMNGASPLWMGR
ncbi:vWA domain-containing protein [Sorangium sp. So ce341]|uniref:vWA domain-containing protein n=1 Tax=Sorangium sp. So ce341 TaxID=3133302 RepID=UPI003F640EA3